jgi:hypothetical protein
LIVFFPGTYAWDGFRQLNEFYGYLPRTTHHPYLATTLMGGLFSVGRVFGVNGALFFYTLVQATAACLVFALTCARILRLTGAALGQRKAWTFALYGLALGFFALNPIFPVATTVVFKDLPYALSVLLLVNVLALAAIRRSLQAQSMVLFVVGAVGAAGFRNDGIVIVVACTVILALVLRRPKQRRRVVLAGAAVTVGLIAANSLVFPLLGVSKYSNAEMLSIPLQQTARYLRDHPDDISAAELSTIQSLLKDDRRVEDLAEKYKPTLSDPVKNSFRSFDGESLRRYASVWLATCARHLGTCVKATAANTVGYFYPSSTGNIPPISYPYQMHLKSGYWEGLKAELSKPEASFDPSYPAALQPARSFVLQAARWVTVKSPIWPLFRPAVYTWLLLGATAALIWRRRWRALTAFIPVGLVFLVCLASPVNGNVRYALPYVVATPLLMAYTIYALRRPSASDRIPAHDRRQSQIGRWPRPTNSLKPITEVALP